MRHIYEVETLEPRRLLAGVTVLVTGRLGGTNGWMQSMADDITARLGGPSQVPNYRLSINADSNTGNLVPTMQHVSGTATPQSNTSGEIVVLIDYYNVSANPIYSSTSIGSVIANYFMNTTVDGIRLASLPIHGVGVSRGSAIIDGMAQTLGQAGVWVDQETYLDPNPISAQGDPPDTIFDNVAFVDDYWRNDGSASQINDGHPVTGGYNLNVQWLDSNNAGYAVPHLAPSGYYIGTIDLNATYGGEGPIYSTWYGNTPSMPARNQTGFIYTSIVGAARPLSGVWSASGGTGTRTAAGQQGTQWANATDLVVTSGNTVAAGNSIQVSYLHQDRDSGDTITFYLDSDRNPYNNAFAATLGSSNLAQANSIVTSTATLPTGGVSAGTYWVCAQITDAAGHTRYTYSPVTAPLQVTSTPNPVATLAATVPVTTGGVSSQPEQLVVTYTGTAPINTNTLDSSDLQVSGPGFTKLASYVGVDSNTGSNTRVATYSVAAPTGGWVIASNGTYTVSVQSNQVSDTSNRFVAASSIGNFVVSIGGASIVGSLATAAPSYNLTTLGTSDWAHWGRGANAGNFDHKASGGSQISNVTAVGTGANTGGYSNTSRISNWTDGVPTASDANESGFIYSNGALNSGLSFTVPADTTSRTLTVYAGGSDTLSSLTAHLSDNSTADYTVTAGQNGTYTNVYTIVYRAASAGQTLKITLLKTANLAGPTSSADLIAAWLSGAPAGDTAKPTATLQPTSNIAASNSAETLKVVYTDNVAVKASTLATGNLVLSGPTSQTAAFVSSSPSTDNATITATYSVAAPAGGWTTAANGTYNVSLAASSVSDTNSNFAATTMLGSFQIAIPGPDVTPPQASLQTPSNVTASNSAETLQVVYTDNIAVKASTLATGNIVLSGPTAQTATFVSSLPSSDNATITATYSVAAPAGGWTTAANGTYNVSLADSSVSDTNSNFATTTALGLFQIAISAPGAGSVSGQFTAAAASYNLTALGTSDWAHWGRASNAGNFDHKATGGSQISNVTAVGSGANTGGYSNTIRSATWTDGTPTVSDANESGFIYSNGALNTGLSFTVPADSTTRTLTVYAGGADTTSSLTAHLSDGSAADYTVSTGQGGVYSNVYTIVYHAASAGQTLKITLLKTANLAGPTSSADLIAAWLSGAPAGDTAKPTATLQATSSVTVSNSAETLKVVYTDNVAVKASTLATGNLVLSGPTAQTAAFVSASPSTDNATITATYSVAAPAGGWTTAANGTYNVSLADSSVSDTNSNFATTTALGLFQIAIPAPGAGSVAGQFTAAAASSYNLTTLGTSDWAHWGRASNAGNFDHKATGGSQISNVTAVGTGANTGGYSNTARTFSWTDGTPTASDANEHGFIYSNGALNSGLSFTVPADTTTRTLTIYAGGADTTSLLTAHLSDGSAADYTVTTGQKGVYTNVYTIVYHAASAGQTLTITLVKTANLVGTTSSVDLIAATLA